jgi:REP element-mobilizing transposase RayT
MRTIRLYVPGNVHHVICRFVDRRFFLEVPDARDRYLRLLGRAIAKSDWSVIAYALMSNHVHLLTVAGEQEPEHWQRRAHSPFGLWVNKHVEGLGTVFANRPRLYIVQHHRVADVLAYIHNNPVRAGVVARASDSTWTSHRSYLGLDPSPPWLDTEAGMRLVGSPSPSQLDAFVNREVGTSDPVAELARVEAGVRPLAHKRGGAVATAVYGDVPQVTIVRREHSRFRPDPASVIATACYAAGVSRDLVYERGQGAIRRVVLFVGRRFGLSYAEMSGAMGFSRQFAQQLMNDATTIDLAAVERATMLLHEGRWIRPVDKLASDSTQVRGKIAGRRR